MIFQRAIRRELWNTVGAVFTTLFTVVITVVLIRILGDAAAGKVASTDVAALLGFATLGYLPVIISLTAFIAVLLVVARSYQDSEMVVWFSSGLSLVRWVRPVLQVGMPLVIVSALLSLWLTPWANRSAAEYKERFRNREDVSRIAPGKFQESAGGDKIFFVEGLTTDTTKVKNVFVRQAGGSNDTVVVAEEGAVVFDEHGDKLLQLFKGRRYDGAPGADAFRAIDFERYTIVVSQSTREPSDNKSARALPTVQLIGEPSGDRQAELLWRISVPIMCVVQMLLAVPLGFVNPRRGRALNLMIALLLAITYTNAVGILQAQVGSGRLAFAAAWWPLHLFALLVIAVLFVLRGNTNSRWHPTRLWSLMRRALLVRREKAA